jgi:hypothetical protein
MSYLDYHSIRYATLSKTFCQQIVFHCITDLSNLFEICWRDLSRLKIEDIDDNFIQRFKNLSKLDAKFGLNKVFSVTDIGLKTLKNLSTLKLPTHIDHHKITDEVSIVYSILLLLILVIIKQFRIMVSKT